MKTTRTNTASTLVEQSVLSDGSVELTVTNLTEMRLLAEELSGSIQWLASLVDHVTYNLGQDVRDRVCGN